MTGRFFGMVGGPVPLPSSEFVEKRNLFSIFLFATQLSRAFRKTTIQTCISTILGFVIVFCLPTPSLGQPSRASFPDQPAPSLDAEKQFTQFIQEAWQTENGLPQNTVRAIVQTRDGYLWLGTQEGLVRFDGVRFTTFDRSIVDELQSSLIITLDEDREGALWIGTQGGGLSRFKDGRFLTYTENDGLPGNNIYAVHSDRHGRIWAGTIGGGIVRLENGSFKVITTHEGLASDIVLSIDEDREGRIWIGSDGGLSVWDNGVINTFGLADGLPGRVIRSVLIDRNDKTWIGTENGLAQIYDGVVSTYSTQNGLTDNVITSLYEDRAGTLWVGTMAGGVCRKLDHRFSCYTSSDGLTHDNVRAIYEDREGSLWIGTDGGGINRLRDGKFTPYATEEGLTQDVVYTVFEDRSGTVWIGTEGGGVTRLINGKLSAFTPSGILADDIVSSLAQSSDGSIWIGTDGSGLYRFNGKNTEQYTSAGGLPGDMIRAIYEDLKGQMWVGTDNGLASISGDRITTYTTHDGLPADVVVSIVGDGTGGLWVGTFGGLAHLANGKIETFGASDGLSNGSILTVFRDNQNVIWIGTSGGGLYRFKDGVFNSFTTKDGLPSDIVVQIIDDDQGRLWVGTNKGIFHISRQQLDQYADGRITALTPVIYGRSDGLKSVECNGGMQPAVWKARDGRLWFSTLRGVATIDPANIPVNEVRPPVVIEQFIVNGQFITGQESIRLPAGSDDFEFHYTGLSLSSPDEVRFKYMLEGQDDDWHDPTERRTAYYTNLAPGHYTFRVQAANDDGLWSESDATLSFSVAPYFYQTYWFYALCAVALLLSGTGIHRLRIRQLRAREKQLVQIVNERTKELKELNERLEERVREQVDMILRSKRLTKYFPRQIVDQIISAESEVDLTSERKQVTVFFSDLTGFTELSERTPPEQITWLLNDYLSEMVAIIEKYGGTLDKFMGDGLMAFFGAPGEMSAAEQAERAVSMAVEMQHKVTSLAEKWRQNIRHDLKVRMGIHQSWATVGNFGSRELMEFTAIGQGVNLAKRLESACTPGRILVSSEVYMLTYSRFDYNEAIERSFKGISQSMMVWELDPASVPAQAC